MNIIKWLFGKKVNVGTPLESPTYKNVNWVVPKEQMNEHQRTEMIIDMPNLPYITLTDCKFPCMYYYHDEIDFVFIITKMGFKRKLNVSKKSVERFLRTNSHKA